MNSLRSLVLMLVVSTFPAFLVPAYAQQEVDPDHFDQVQAKAPVSKSQADHKMASSHHHASHVRLASKHSSNRSHHHQAHASA